VQWLSSWTLPPTYLGLQALVAIPGHDTNFNEYPTYQQLW
jgi:hypothetical protein